MCAQSMGVCTEGYGCAQRGMGVCTEVYGCVHRGVWVSAQRYMGVCTEGYYYEAHHTHTYTHI